MRKLVLLLLLLLPATFMFGQISTFPYFYDFDSLSTCAASCGSACVLSTTSGWENDTVNDNFDWTVDQNGTSSGNTGPSGDHTTGSDNYLYIESSSPCNGGSQYANLLTPYFDFSSTPGGRISFWYHMFGASQGTMHFDVDTTGGTGPWILDYVPAWTDNVDAWQEKVILGCDLGGLDSVRFRIRGVVGTSFTSDMAVDDFWVDALTPGLDVGVVSIDSLPASSCGLGLETIHVTVANLGCNDVPSGTAIPISFSDGTTTLTDSIVLSATLTSLSTVSGSFSNQFDFSTPGPYNLMAWTSLTGDGYPANDSSMGSVFSIPTISSFPYLEDFENGSAGWTSGGANSTWEYGAFGTSIPPSPSCGSNGWGTGMNSNYNNNENSYLQGPCFDFSGLTTDPTLRFLHWYNTENNYDENWVEYSTDGGTTWNRVGSSGTGLNWYNDAGNQWWENVSPGWQPAENTLTGLAGQPSVLLRFFMSSDGSVQRPGVGVDDIMIYTGGLTEASPLALLSPQSGCGLTNADTLIGQFSNNGTDTLTNVPFCYILDNGTPVCDTFPGPVFPGDTVTHAFSTTGDFSTTGPHTVSLTVSAPGDFNSCNDTVMFTVENVPQISGFPYFENFENGTGGWQSGGTNSTWAFGTPAKTVIQGAASGSNSWVTGGLGTGEYNNNEDSWVISPCFDFSTAPQGLWVAVKIWWDIENSWDGSNLQYTTDGGTTWTNVGAYLDPFNWYNDNTINGNPGGSQEGWSGWQGSSGGPGQYLIAKHELDTALIGQPEVRFRMTMGTDGSVQYEGISFDDFAIGIPTPVSIGPDTTVCGGHWMTNSNGTMGQAWDWSNGASGPMIQLINTDTVARVDTLILTYTDTLGLCTWDTAVVTVDPAPFFELTDTSICSYDMITLDPGVSGYSYMWSTGDTTQSIMAGPGSYGLTAMATGFTCTYTDSVHVWANGEVDLMDTMMFCPGDTLMLDAMIAGSYAWSNGDTTQMTMVSMPGAYSVVVTDGDGCISADTTMTMTEAPVDLGPDSLLCDGATLMLDAGLMGTYTWSTGDTTQMVTASTAGTYSVMVNSMLGCMSSDSVVITTAATPVSSFSVDTSACPDIVFSDGSTNTPTTWAWDFGDASGTSTMQNPNYTYGSNGSYTVTLITSTVCGADTTTETVDINCIVGMEELLPYGAVTIYPNPNQGNFFVSLNGVTGDEAIVEVYNLYGQKIQTESFGQVISERTEAFQLNNAAKGVYFVKVTIDGKSMRQRIVVQ